MGPRSIEVNAPLLDKHLSFAEAVEQFPIQELISELAIEAFTIAVLPRTAWRDVGCLGTQAFEPVS